VSFAKSANAQDLKQHWLRRQGFLKSSVPREERKSGGYIVTVMQTAESRKRQNGGLLSLFRQK